MTSNLNPVAQSVMEALLRGGTDAAERYYREELMPADAAAKAAALKAAADMQTARNIIDLAKGIAADKAPEPALVRRPVTLSDDEAHDAKRTAVLQVANDLAGANDEGVVTTDGVQQELTVRGSPIIGQRPGTSIGNILVKGGRWLRIEEGKYRRK